MRETVYLQVLVTAEEWTDIQNFMRQFGIRTKKEAVRQLIQLGLKAHNVGR